ncbi:hypothetical protein O181_014017 [Austropuccinia psidii MF-1]|uniref:Uncharacterized protein n=1 Tax=Austropuccinia psidii MF-1 TaxID=1389203 RepID=A0A9Q3C0U6_9BASI|nr:hypothetical protein [Austropuccinia psidii MF-1]
MIRLTSVTHRNDKIRSPMAYHDSSYGRRAINHNNDWLVVQRSTVISSIQVSLGSLSNMRSLTYFSTTDIEFLHLHRQPSPHLQNLDPFVSPPYRASGILDLVQAALFSRSCWRSSTSAITQPTCQAYTKTGQFPRLHLVFTTSYDSLPSTTYESKHHSRSILASYDVLTHTCTLSKDWVGGSPWKVASGMSKLFLSKNLQVNFIASLTFMTEYLSQDPSMVPLKTASHVITAWSILLTLHSHIRYDQPVPPSVGPALGSQSPCHMGKTTTQQWETDEGMHPARSGPYILIFGMSAPVDTATTPLARLVESSNPSVIGTKRRKSSTINRLQNTDSVMLDASAGDLSDGSQTSDVFVQQKAPVPAKVSFITSFNSLKKISSPFVCIRAEAFWNKNLTDLLGPAKNKLIIILVRAVGPNVRDRARADESLIWALLKLEVRPSEIQAQPEYVKYPNEWLIHIPAIDTSKMPNYNNALRGIFCDPQAPNNLGFIWSLTVGRDLKNNWTGKVHPLIFTCYIPALLASACINKPPFTSGVTSFISGSGKTFDAEIGNVSPKTSLFGELSVFTGVWRVEVTRFPDHSLLDEYWKGKDKITMPVIWKGERFDLDLVSGCSFCRFEEHDDGQLCPYEITLKAARLRDIDKEFQHQLRTQVVTVPSRRQARNFNCARGEDTRPPSLPRPN